MDVNFGRISDLNGLPELIVHHAGDEGLFEAFARQSLPLELLDTPEALIPMRDLIALYRNAADVSAIRSFGLDAAQDLDISTYPIIGPFILQAPSLRQALVRFQKALPYYENGSRLTLQESGNEFIVGYENIYQNMVGFRHAGDMTIRIIQAVIRAFAGSLWQPRRVLTCYPKGPWEQDFEEAFSSPIEFRENMIALVLERDLVDSATNDRETQQGELVCFADLRRFGQDLPIDFPGIVANLVDSELPTGLISLDGISARLALGPRTVQRRLDECGLNFRNLVTRCRMKRARELLSEADASVELVSLELGYSSVSHFTRAFSKDHGIGPSEFRQTR